MIKNSRLSSSRYDFQCRLSSYETVSTLQQINQLTLCSLPLSDILLFLIRLVFQCGTALRKGIEGQHDMNLSLMDPMKTVSVQHRFPIWDCLKLSCPGWLYEMYDAWCAQFIEERQTHYPTTVKYLYSSGGAHVAEWDTELWSSKNEQELATV